MKDTSIEDQVCQAYLNTHPIRATQLMGTHLDQVTFPFTIIDPAKRLEQRLTKRSDPIHISFRDILSSNREFCKVLKPLALLDTHIFNPIQDLLDLVNHSRQPLNTNQQFLTFKLRFINLQQMIAVLNQSILQYQTQGYHYPTEFIKSYIYSLQHLSFTPTYAPAMTWFQQIVQPFATQWARWMQHHLIPSSNPQYGLYGVRHRDKFYRACIKYHTGHAYSPDEIYQLGQVLVHSLHQQQLDLIHQTYPDLTPQEFVFSHHFGPSNRFAEKQEMVEYARSLLRLFDQQVREHFTLPTHYQTPVLKTVHNIKEILGWATSPSLKNNQPPVFYMNTASWDVIPKSDLVPFILHEAIPGHAFQSQFNDIPECLRVFNFFTNVGEGIGLYAESCFEPRDLHSMYSRLHYQIWRALRLVVDSGIHHFGWSIDQALTFMKQYCYHDEDILRTEIIRYANNPGQACAYFIGYLDLKELEKEWRKLHPEHDSNPYAFFNELLKCSKYSLCAIRHILLK